MRYNDFMKFKKSIKWFILIFFIVSITMFNLSFFVNSNIVKTLAITFITIFYHTCIRPLTGIIIDKIYHNKMNFNLWWFKERKFEKNLYKILQVKCWKKFIPTYDKSAFDINNKNIAYVLGSTCQAEIVHEIMFVLSFLPLLLIIPYGEPIIFIITSIICALIECVFIIIQRFNRPRLKKLYNKLSVDKY